MNFIFLSKFEDWKVENLELEKSEHSKTRGREKALNFKVGMNIRSKLFIRARKLFQIVIVHLVKVNIADPETAEILNNFFSKIVQNLDITRYQMTG